MLSSSAMRAEIIAVGSELLMGETADTNSSWLAVHMPEVGLELHAVTIVGDDLAELTEVVRRAWGRSDFVFTIGGLGPTLDDLTRDAIAATLGEPMSEDPELVRWLEENFARRGVGQMPRQNLRQTLVIPSAAPIRNEMGTAPSWWVRRDGKAIVTLPGPPSELMHMWTAEIAPRLKKAVTGSVILTRTFKTIGLSEAAVDEMCAHLYDMEGMDFGCYAKPDGIYLRAVARAPNEEAALETLAVAEQEARQALGAHLWGVDDETPQGRVGELLRERGYRLGVLESLTGGLVSGAITETPGASEYFAGGVVVYSNEAKIAAGVPADTIRRFGAVSAETAEAMANAARNAFGAECGIGVTGVAGPDPQPEEDAAPGTVFIAAAYPGGADVQKHVFPPRRPLVRGRAVAMTLLQLAHELQKAGVEAG